MRLALNPRPAGGSARGWSYYKTWKDCQFLWFLRYLYRSDGGIGVVGVEPRFTARPLLLGSLFHAAAEAYYRSAWDEKLGDTGAYSVEAGCIAAERMAEERKAEWQRPDDAVEDFSAAASLISQYGNHYGQGGTEQDYPHYKVAAFNGGPAVELELAIDLEDGLDSIFTTKFDAVLEDRHGVLWGLEHKTSAAGRVHALFQKAYLDGQITGQCATLMAHFPGREVGGVALNAVVKDAAKGKPRFRRQLYQRTEDQLVGFLTDIRRVSQAINWRTKAYEEEVRADDLGPYKGDKWAIALSIFDSTPPADRCYGFGKCDFYDVCLDRSMGEQLLEGGDFVPKLPHGAAALEVPE